MPTTPSPRTSVALLAFSIGLAACHRKAPSPVEIKIDGPALATVLFSGDGWGEYAPCG